MEENVISQRTWPVAHGWSQDHDKDRQGKITFETVLLMRLLLRLLPAHAKQITRFQRTGAQARFFIAHRHLKGKKTGLKMFTERHCLRKKYFFYTERDWLFSDSKEFLGAVKSEPASGGGRTLGASAWKSLPSNP